MFPIHTTTTATTSGTTVTDAVLFVGLIAIATAILVGVVYCHFRFRSKST